MKKAIIFSSLIGASLLPSSLNATSPVEDTGNTSNTGTRNQTTTGANTCHNEKITVGCGPCEESKNSTSGTTCPAESNTTSLIMNGGLRYFTWSHDYKYSTSTSSCAPCGGGASTSAGSGLPQLEITRFFEPESYTREHLTFGAMHGMKKYDQRLQFTAGHSAVIFDDYGSQISKRSLEFNAAQQCWRERNDRKDQGVASLHLFDAAGLPIVTAATRNNAHTAILLNFDGSTVHYQVMWDANGSGNARPIAFLDRHGNAIEIEYTDAQPPYGTPALDSFRPYFRKSVMRDAHGREAQFTYQNLFGKQVCTKIDLPNGEEINYSYVSGALLNKVTHADGTESIWEKTVNTVTKLDEYTLIDAKSDPGHRRKRIFFSQGQAFAPGGGVMSVTRNRVRRAQNGAGEFAWDSRMTSDLTYRYIYEGGNSVRKISFYSGGKGLGES